VTPLTIVKRTMKEFNQDDALDRAAALSYYFLLALFPLMIFLLSVLGFVMGQNSSLQTNMMQYMGRVLPPQAFELVSKTLTSIVQASGAGKLSFGLVFTLWSATGGVSAIMSAMNIAYDVREGRSFIKTHAIAVGLTIALAILGLGGLALVLFGAKAAAWIAGKWALGSVFVIAWRIAQWPVVLFLLSLAFAAVYYYAPDVEEQHWYWITPGAVVGVGLWILGSIGFRIYLNYFNSYSKTYGSLGALIILMLWFYLTGLALIIGGELNSEIEHAAAEHGDPTAKDEGEKVPEQKAA
jgi:membrane protein